MGGDYDGDRISVHCFQFLGIPPKGERRVWSPTVCGRPMKCFQFLGIPPKGELMGFRTLSGQWLVVSNF